jgi:crotonobetainyl-CoA:carnitine CoA-transferase CaiB-like acyl-CoA transferase
MPTNADGWPAGQPSAAFGDVMGGLATAGAIAAALVQRERGGEPTVVDVSLLATAMWQLSPMVVAAKLFGLTRLPTANRLKNPNPGVNTYRTSDDRFISLVLLQSDKFWDDLARRLERPELTTDERFSTSAARAQNSEACVAVLDEAFGAKPLGHWKEVLADFAGVWTPYQTLDELYGDPQVIANGYLPAMEAPNGQQVQLVASPAHLHRSFVELRRAPEHGEHTEQVLLDAGFDWEAIAAMKESGAIL